jgi:hypothetical protein
MIEKTYTLTQDQLYDALSATVQMYLEYLHSHGQTEEQAKTSACLEIIESLDADKDLVDWDVTENSVLQVYEG